MFFPSASATTRTRRLPRRETAASEASHQIGQIARPTTEER